MLEIKLLKSNIKKVADSLKLRGYLLDVSTFQLLENQRKVLQTQTQHIQCERNKCSDAIGHAIVKGKSVKTLLKKVSNLSEILKAKEVKLQILQRTIQDLLLTIPNISHKSVPIGNNDSDNFEVRKWGELPDFKFNPKEHDELGMALNGIDFESGIAISGSRFVVLKGQLAHLHRSLGQFMLNLHIQQHGYEEVYVPYLVKSDSMYGTGQFPKFEADQFCTRDGDYWLIPTAEVPVTNLVREQIIDAKQLPLKFVCHSPCFRREAGTYGKDSKGMIRQHQFEKVELVQIVKPESSYEALEELTSHAEIVLQQLNLPYRVVNLCTGNIGFSAAKTYDIEAWMPGQNRYREISSCSNTEAFQARRMQTRCRYGNKKPELVHTLNGSGVAVGRAFIAVLENFQDEKGRIHIPKVLQPYMNDLKIID